METTRAGFLGGAFGGAAAVALPNFVSQAAAATPAVLPGLEPGVTLPATLPTRQLVGVESFKVIDAYPEPRFEIHAIGGGKVGTLAFQHKRSSTGHGSDGISVDLGSGKTAVHTIKADAAGKHAATGAVIARAGDHVFRAKFHVELSPSSRELQPAYRVTDASLHVDGKSRKVTLPDHSFVIWPGRSADSERARRVLKAFETAAHGSGAQGVFDDDTFRVLATLAADPLLIAYEALNPAYGAGVAGAWQLPSIFQCLDGRLVRQTPAAFAYYGIGCVAAVAGPAFDETGVKGFRAPKL
jgi:hypothetical protein